MNPAIRRDLTSIFVKIKGFVKPHKENAAYRKNTRSEIEIFVTDREHLVHYRKIVRSCINPEINTIQKDRMRESFIWWCSMVFLLAKLSWSLFKKQWTNAR
jgi:hypothetical protein